MGQVQSQSPSDLAVPPPSRTSGSAGFRLKCVFGSRKKRHEDISPSVLVTVAPLPIGMGKSHSVMMQASSTMPSTSAPKLLHQPSVSAGPGYLILPFTQYVPAQHSSTPSKPLPESHLPAATIGSKNFHGSYDSWFHNSPLWG